jgi:glucosamine--fructose-6-phosphate aminotransferase (isomerizing)
MCGITACIGREQAAKSVLTGLENLEYRGYDSAGIAMNNGNGVEVLKREGNVENLAAELENWALNGSVGIGHTRWSTHGEPSDRNAHPHTDCNDSVAVVHNGIIENYATLRSELAAAGHTFTSDTDTEVIPHLVGSHLAEGLEPRAAFREAVKQLEGSYAIAMLVAENQTVYATRQGSPLVFGLDEGSWYLASDVPAFLEFTDDVVFLEDGDVVEASVDGFQITDIDGNQIERDVRSVDWCAEDTQKGRYDHFMLKEIHEQPTALRQSIQGRVEDEKVVIEELSELNYDDVTSVQFVACGTSYHAALYGTRLLGRHGIPAQAYLASEFTATDTSADPGTLVVGVTQSGETADTLQALRGARADGLRTLAITNTVGSTATRECDDTMFIRAGPEIGVAATKTFSSQVVSLLLFGAYLAESSGRTVNEDTRQALRALGSLPDQVQSLLDTSMSNQIAKQYRDSQSYFFVGRDVGYPVALEGALKLKEISYEHAEGFAAGELKHGPLALVTPETPVFAIVTGRNEDKMVGNIEEIRARGAPVIVVAPPSARAARAVATDVLSVPATHPDLVGLLANVQLQLISYHTASLMGRAIDKPRNLAKSVTVE